MLISKSFSFDMAHMLDGYEGKCKNLHGHTYQLKVFIDGKTQMEGANEGMVEDYGRIKSLVKENILIKLDHSFIYNTTNEFESSIAGLLESKNRKTYGIPCRTTAENISMIIYNSLKSELKNVESVEVSETGSSSAIYKGEE